MMKMSTGKLTGLVMFTKIELLSGALTARLLKRIALAANCTWINYSVRWALANLVTLC